MKVVVTGASSGIGKATVERFLRNGHHEVIGIDVLPSTVDADLYKSCPDSPSMYTHHIVSIIDTDNLPEVEDVNILINNAGVQDSGHDIDINLKGTINCTEKYAIQPNIKSVVNVASVSAHNGAEFPEYCASKGGMLSYTKNVAKRIAKFGATCNSISPGGVITELNNKVIDDKDKWAAIMEETPLKKWAAAEEIADWIYFMSVNNVSMTGQDILIDNGEMINHNFIW